MRDRALWFASLFGVPAAPSVDPLLALSDDFSTGSTMTGNGWTIEDSTPSASPSDLITSGEADLTIANGGVSGSFWFDANDGVLWYKTVTGACDFRARVRVQNAAGTGLPPATSFRIAGIQAADPDRTTYEYVHVGLGAINTGVLSIEWKTTDNSDSAYGGSALTLTGGEILYDLRIVRRSSDLQIFDLYVRAGTAEALASDTGWTLFQTIDRSDDTVPDRVANFGTVAVPLPDTLRWGLIIYALGSTHNIRMYVAECLFSTPVA